MTNRLRFLHFFVFCGVALLTMADVWSEKPERQSSVAIRSIWLVDSETGDRLLRLKNRARIDLTPYGVRNLNILVTTAGPVRYLLFKPPYGGVRKIRRKPFHLLSQRTGVGLTAWNIAGPFFIRIAACLNGCQGKALAEIEPRFTFFFSLGQGDPSPLPGTHTPSTPAPGIPVIRTPLPSSPADSPNTPLPSSSVTATATPERNNPRGPDPTPILTDGTPVPVPAGSTTPTTAPIPTQQVPVLNVWQEKMVSYGRRHCAQLVTDSNNGVSTLSNTYYDAMYVYQQIGEYTGDPLWGACAGASEKQYRDLYVIPNSGKVPAYWIFTSGLTKDALLTGDETSKRAVDLLSVNGAYAPDQTPISWLQGWEYSRETALNILSYLDAERLGGARRARLALLVDTALGHIDQWFVRKNATYVKSFMVGITCLALIEYHAATGDSRVIPAVRTALDGLWEVNWSESSRAFKYTNIQNPGDDPPVPAPDLNLIIAPAYEWLYRQTNEQRFRVRGDKIFAGGVELGYAAGAKQFNQLYRWSFDYVHLRAQP